MFSSRSRVALEKCGGTAALAIPQAFGERLCKEHSFVTTSLMMGHPTMQKTEYLLGLL